MKELELLDLEKGQDVRILSNITRTNYPFSQQNFEPTLISGEILSLGLHHVWVEATEGIVHIDASTIAMITQSPAGTRPPETAISVIGPLQLWPKPLLAEVFDEE